MTALSSVSNHELRERFSAAVSAERLAAADVIHHLAGAGAGAADYLPRGR